VPIWSVVCFFSSTAGSDTRVSPTSSYSLLGYARSEGSVVIEVYPRGTRPQQLHLHAITRLAGPGWTGEERLGGEQVVVLEAEP
jgi:hypothetical protein